MQVRELMTPDALFIHPDATLSEAAMMMRKHDCGSLPVGENDRLVGIVTDRDLVVRGMADNMDPSSSHVRSLMSDGVVYCTTDDSVEDAATRMKDHQVRRLIVLDDNKRFAGMLSFGDLASQINDTELAGDVASTVFAN